jgi:hypothetical protein
MSQVDYVLRTNSAHYLAYAGGWTMHPAYAWTCWRRRLARGSSTVSSSTSPLCALPHALCSAWSRCGPRSVSRGPYHHYYQCALPLSIMMLAGTSNVCLLSFVQAHELNDAQTHTFNTWSLVLMVGASALTTITAFTVSSNPLLPHPANPRLCSAFKHTSQACCLPCGTASTRSNHRKVSVLSLARQAAASLGVVCVVARFGRDESCRGWCLAVSC